MNRPMNRKASSALSLRRQVKGINEDIDGRTGSLLFLVELRGQDNRRIAQLQRETALLFKRAVAGAARGLAGGRGQAGAPRPVINEVAWSSAASPGDGQAVC